MVAVDVDVRFGVDGLVKRVVTDLRGPVERTSRVLVIGTLRLGARSGDDAVVAASSVLWAVEDPGTSALKNRSNVENRTCWLRGPW